MGQAVSGAPGSHGSGHGSDAQAVIVGAGIVGCSIAYHLTRRGWRDVVVLDRGRLFETGGSTPHAPGLVIQTNASRTLTALAKDTVALYSRLEWEATLPAPGPAGQLATGRRSSAPSTGRRARGSRCSICRRSARSR